MVDLENRFIDLIKKEVDQCLSAPFYLFYNIKYHV